MKFELTEAFNMKAALRGMRNPKNSWDRTDSKFDLLFTKDTVEMNAEKHPVYAVAETNIPSIIRFSYIGPNDLKLAQQLIGAGPEHCKFLRQIGISVDITAPLYWWKEFDTYKVGTTANSTSTMHKLMSKPITLESFEIDDFRPEVIVDKAGYNAGENMNSVIDMCEDMRKHYLELKDSDPEAAKLVWKELVRILPEGWLQTRTISMSYANARNIYFQRRNHKLTEWHQFCAWVESLPFAKELITYEKPHVCKCEKAMAVAGKNIATPDMSKKIKVRVGSFEDPTAPMEDRGSFDTTAEAMKYIIEKANRLEGRRAMSLLWRRNSDQAIVKFDYENYADSGLAYYVEGASFVELFEEAYQK